MADAPITSATLPNPSLGVGDVVPDFDLPSSFGGRVRLAALHGKPFVLYFYPKADTSGCTAQAQAFQNGLDLAGKDPIPVIGISKDTLKAIDAFAKKYHLRFRLASDETGTMLEAFGVWVQKSMYGRSYMGIERSTFLIGADGRIAQVWRKVKVPGHADEVMKAAASLQR